MIGSYSCPITSNTATQIVCQLGTNSGLIAGIQYSVEVQIKNLGNALQTNAIKFNFLPKITSVSPNTGSLL